MAYELKKALSVKLRSIGLDERWLQDRIAEDPGLLGLGDLSLLGREKAQPTGGRLDFLLWDPDAEVRYEVELMLGTLDESHIIRTIEYWDIERQRYPAYTHRAVIIAEDITSRFFNVIRLLNRAVPIIAVQLNAFTFGTDVVLQFTKVLDILEEADDTEEASGEQADRAYWDRRSGAVSLQVLDAVVALVKGTFGTARVTYNRNHVAMGTAGNNFCWFSPRKSTPHCHMRFKTGNDGREDIISSLEEAGIPATAFQSDLITLKLTPRQLSEGQEAFAALLQRCEVRSRHDDSAA